MSASDQSTPAAESPVTDEPDELDEATEDPAEDEAEDVDEGDDHVADEDIDEDIDEAEGESDEDDEGEEAADPADGMTPTQARRLRVAAASVLLVVMGVVLVIRLASRTSVLVVGVYGLAMILCGIVIELSRNGRTRLGTWLLVSGLAAALAFDWLILP
ncbi:MULTISPECIES: hypothetical protein [Streptomyces]|uniref:Uncharacterized protein n=2 Tax=Streptomyces TaxID=1883 RepID=A0ABU4KD31_9ACTN|nr:hypothetical protein [Streptomyces roseolus]MDX2295685.1 hypothetical protein [Streptomyces roseolus]